MMNLFLFK